MTNLRIAPVVNSLKNILTAVCLSGFQFAIVFFLMLASMGNIYEILQCLYTTIIICEIEMTCHEMKSLLQLKMILISTTTDLLITF